MADNHRLPFLIAFSNVLVFLVISLVQVASRAPIYYVVPQDIVGYDYRDFYYASVSIANGESPYSVSRYVTPPLPALANMLLLPFGFEFARNIFILLIPLFVFGSYLVIYLGLQGSNSDDRKWLLLSGIFVIVSSYPVYFLLERGNIDAIVLFCMCAGLVLLPKRTWLGSFLLAAASLFKLYPMLIPVSLLFARRWKPFFWICGWILGLVLLTIPYWADYLASSYHRAYYFRLDENGSLVNTMMIVLVLLQVQFTGNLTNIFEQSSSILTAIVYGITLVIVLYSDYRASASATQQERLSNMLLYFPLMIAIPQLVYHYEFVVLIPLLPVLSFMWKDTLPLPKKICLALMAVGIALSQWQAIALYVLTGNMLAQYIPGIGLLFVIIGVAIYKLLSLKEAVINEAAGLKPS
jgi:hypothetical protein